MMLLESTEKLDANSTSTNNKRTVSVESGSTTNFPILNSRVAKVWHQWGFLEGWCGVISYFIWKISYILKCGIETTTPWDEDWKESQRLQTPKWRQNIEVVLHPDQNFSNNEPEVGEQCLLKLNAALNVHCALEPYPRFCIFSSNLLRKATNVTEASFYCF